MIKKGFQCGVLFLSIFVAGCSSLYYGNSSPYINKTGQMGLVGMTGGAVVGAYTGGGLGASVGALAGGIVGTTVGHFLQVNQTLIQKIEEQGVQVVAVGDNVLLILPSDRFFFPNSPNRVRDYDPALDEIAQLLSGYEKITVKVAAYTDETCNVRRAKALTEEQAHSIADYLWDKGIDTRLIYSAGYGHLHPIAQNTTASGRSQNRRIEITLRQLPKCCELN